MKQQYSLKSRWQSISTDFQISTHNTHILRLPFNRITYLSKDMNTNYNKPFNWIPKFFPPQPTWFLSWMARALVQILIGTRLQQKFLQALCRTASYFVYTSYIFEHVCRLVDKNCDTSEKSMLLRKSWKTFWFQNFEHSGNF